MRFTLLSVLVLLTVLALASAVSLDRYNKANKLQNEGQEEQDISKRRIAFLEERINQAEKTQDIRTADMLRTKLQQFQAKEAQRNELKLKSKIPQEQDS